MLWEKIRISIRKVRKIKHIWKWLVVSIINGEGFYLKRVYELYGLFTVIVKNKFTYGILRPRQIWYRNSLLS